MTASAKFKPFNVVEHLDTPAARAAYLRGAWKESAGDATLVALALGDVARAIGMTNVAADAGVAREALYKALGPKGNPEFATVLRVLGRLLAFRASYAILDNRQRRRSSAVTRARSKDVWLSPRTRR